jgi:hypothetical protein
MRPSSDATDSDLVRFSERRHPTIDLARRGGGQGEPPSRKRPLLIRSGELLAGAEQGSAAVDLRTLDARAPNLRTSMSGKHRTWPATRAASCAAPKRVGFTSLACIDPDTSNTNTTLARANGTTTRQYGRANATDAGHNASANSSHGTSRRHDHRRSTTVANTSTFVNRTA